MDSTDQYSLRLCVYNLDVVEIIYGQYLKEKKKFSFGKSQSNSNLYMC